MFKESKYRWIKHLDFIILDICILFVSYVLAYYIRHGTLADISKSLYMSVLFIILATDLVGILVLDIYKNVLKRGYYEELKANFKQIALIVSSSTLYLFVMKQATDFSRLTLFYMMGIYFVMGYVARLLLKKIVQKRVKEQPKERMLLVTEKALLKDVVQEMSKEEIRDYEIIGVALTDQGRITDEEVSIILRDNELINVSFIKEEAFIVAGRDELVEYVAHEWIDRILLYVEKKDEKIEELVSSFIEMGITLQMVVMHSVKGMSKYQSIEKVGRYVVVTNAIFHMSTIQIIAKRCIDILAGIVGCIITLVLTVLLGPIIYIQSPGPIFFKQERIGLNGKRFYIYKFRSMYMDAEKRKKELQKDNRVSNGMMFKLDWDPRIIGSKILSDGTHKKGIGNFIRDWSLDEFPQFYNVLKGDMSLVGTRPPTVDEWVKYEKHHRARLAMKPGITGLWQVSGRSNITDFEEVVKLDTQYITEWNMGMDLRILFKTVWVVFHRDGAM